MTAAQGVSPAKGYDLLVIEAHAVEDVPEMLGALGRIWQPSIWTTGLSGDLVTPARPPDDWWT